MKVVSARINSPGTQFKRDQTWFYNFAMSVRVLTARVLIVSQSWHLIIGTLRCITINLCTIIKHEKSLLLFSIKCICVSETGHLPKRVNHWWLVYASSNLTWHSHLHTHIRYVWTWQQIFETFLTTCHTAFATDKLFTVHRVFFLAMAGM